MSRQLACVTPSHVPIAAPLYSFPSSTMQLSGEKGKDWQHNTREVKSVESLEILKTVSKVVCISSGLITRTYFHKPELQPVLESAEQELLYQCIDQKL